MGRAQHGSAQKPASTKIVDATEDRPLCAFAPDEFWSSFMVNLFPFVVRRQSMSGMMPCFIESLH
jgi:hypothetical protein